MARMDEFSFEGHCCVQGPSDSHGVELSCRVCPTSIFVEDGSFEQLVAVVGDHTHMTVEGSKPCQRLIQRREELLSISGRRMF